jgi:hypothetical protein
VADDFNHALGDPLEGQLAAALAYRMTASCPAPTGFSPQALSQRAMHSVTTSVGVSEPDGALRKPPLRENRWYR